MKRILTIISAAALVISMGAVFTACEGPAGKDGTNGKDGLAGANGTNGKDGNATCGVCHNKGTVMFAKILQYETSKHFTGTALETAGSRGNPCIACHTSEGFVQRAATGQDTATSQPLDPTPTNCRTCHNIHTAYDSTDWSLRDTNRIALMINKSITMPSFGKGNLCASCHQPLKPSPNVNSAAGSDSITIKSSRWGIHHGPQSALLAGKAGYEFASGTFRSSRHNTAPDGCITCHMSTTLNLSAGGHTFRASYDPGDGSRVINLSACKVCHTGQYALTAASVTSSEKEVDDLVGQLQAKLLAANIIDSTAEHLVIASSSKPLKITNNQAGAILNYQLVTQDKSHGVHNWNYAKDLLTASIAIFP